MADRDQIKDISFFKPRGATMRGEVRVIKMVMAAWLCAIVGLQLFVAFQESSYSELLISDITFFNLPVHFWLTGHFLPLWFILLCIVFNIWMDRHVSRVHDGSLRFRIRSDHEGDE